MDKSDPPPATPPDEFPARHTTLSKRFNPLLIISLAAILLLAWQWFDTRSQIGALQQELARRLAEAGSYSQESRSIAQQSQQSTREIQAKLALLESKLAESQSQQAALETLYQELSRNRDEWVLAEIEQILLIAGQQLQLSGNVKAALIALRTADGRLQRLDRPQFSALRRAINRDIERLKFTPYVDTFGLGMRLDGLIAAVDALPLAMEMRPPQEQDAAGPNHADENLWRRFARETWQDFKQLVRIQHMDRPDLPLLPPSQIFFLRENLKLRLLGARLALLARDGASFKTDLEAAQAWLGRYYDAQDKGVANALTALRQLHGSEINVELPEITESLDTVRKLSQERSGR